MANRFTDRVATQPNRYKITPADGGEYYATLERADEPTEVGTPLTAENLNEMLDRAGDTMKGNLAMDGYKLTGLGDAVNDGDALSLAFAKTLFAPSGYGLGANKVSYLEDLNAGLTNGWFATTTTTPNVPEGMEYASVHVNVRKADNIVQELTALLPSGMQGCRMIRTTVDGGATWEEEWINPPMKLGVEYRTTERRYGKPVYTILLEPGKTVNGALSVSTGVTGTIIKDTVYAGGRLVPLYDSSGKLLCWSMNSADTIRIYAGSDWNGQSTAVQLWYYK